LNDPDAVEVVRMGQTKYAMDIVEFKLLQARECRFKWGEVLSASNHLPSLLVILWKYYTQCVVKNE
jgi:hypothetical protein